MYKIHTCTHKIFQWASIFADQVSMDSVICGYCTPHPLHQWRPFLKGSHGRSCLWWVAFYKLEAAFVLIGWMRRGAGDYLYPGPKNAKNQRRWLNFPIWYNFVIKFEFEILQHIIILFNLDVHTYLVSPNATFILITKMKRPISYQTKVSCFL